MRNLLLAILIIAPLTYALGEKNKPKPNTIVHVFDSAKYESQLQEFDSLFSVTKSRYQSLTDSLHKELIQYKAKEDYFSVALEDQASRFSTIISIAFGLAALFTYLGFKLESSIIFKKVGEQLKIQRDEHEEHGRIVKKVEKEGYKTSANSNTVIAIHYKVRKEYYNASLFYLLSSKDRVLFLKTLETEAERNEYEPKMKVNFENAHLMLLKEIKKPSNKKLAVKDKQLYFESLETIEECSISFVKELSAKIRLDFISYTTKQDSST